MGSAHWPHPSSHELALPTTASGWKQLHKAAAGLFTVLRIKGRKGSAYWFSCDPDHLRGVVGGLFLYSLFKVQSLNYCSSKFVLVLFSRWDTTVNFHSKRLIVHEVQWCTVQTSAEHSQLSAINSFALANSASLQEKYYQNVVKAWE